MTYYYSEESRLTLYADGGILYSSGSEIEVVIHALNEDVCDILDWCNSNKVVINVENSVGYWSKSSKSKYVSAIYQN